MIHRYENLIEFGNGDVHIYMGLSPDKAALVLRNGQPRPIGFPQTSKLSKSELTTQWDDMLVTFSNPESIDAVIKALQYIRDGSFSNYVGDEEQQ